MIDKPPEMPGQLTLEPPTCHVVIPYGYEQIDPETLAAVTAWGGNYMCQQVSGVLDYAYPEAMAEWWKTGLDTVIVRQDAVIAEGVIRELLACPRPWCVRARVMGNLGPRWNLDVVKVSAQLMASHPKVIDHMIEFHVERGITWEWSEWDEQLAYLLGALDTLMHVHYPRNLAAALSTPAAGGG